jgi:hypothetical protein
MELSDEFAPSTTPLSILTAGPFVRCAGRSEAAHKLESKKQMSNT